MEKCSGAYNKLSGLLENQESTQSIHSVSSSHSDNGGKSGERFSNTNSGVEENSQQFSSSCSVRNSSIAQSNSQQDEKGKSVIQENKPFKIFTRRTRNSPQISQSIKSNGQGSGGPNKETANLFSPTSPSSSRKRRFHAESNHESNQQGGDNTEHKVVSKWLNYYEDEITHEEIEALVNKRSETRKRMKRKREDEMERISGLLCMQTMEEREVPLSCLHGLGFSQEEAMEISDDD